MPTFYTQQEIQFIWSGKNDLQLGSLGATKQVSIHGKQIELGPFRAVGNAPPSGDKNLFGLIKTSRNKPKHVLPTDKPEECKKVCITLWLGDWGKKQSAISVNYTGFRAKAIQEAKDKLIFDIGALANSLTMQWWRTLYGNARKLFQKDDEEFEQRIFISYGIEDSSKYTLPEALPPAIVRLNDLESIVGELVAGMENLGLRVDNIEPRVDSIEPRVDGLETRLDEKGHRLTAVENEVRRLHNALLALQTNTESNQSLGNEIVTMQNALRALSAAVASIQNNSQTGSGQEDDTIEKIRQEAHTRANTTDVAMENIRQEMQAQISLLFQLIDGGGPRTNRQVGFSALSSTASYQKGSAAAGGTSASSTQSTSAMGLHREFRETQGLGSVTQNQRPQQLSKPQQTPPSTPRKAPRPGATRP